MGDDGAAGQATALPSMDLFEGWGDMLSGGPTLLSEGSGEIWAVAERSEHLEVDSGPAAQRRRLNAEGDGLGQQVPQQRQGSRKQPPAKEKKKDREKARRQRENDCFTELGKLVDPGQTGRGDKLSILCGATKEIQRLRTDNDALRKINTMHEDRAEQLRVQQGQQPKSQGLPQGMFPGLQLPHFMFAQPGFQLQMQPQAQSPQQEGSQHVQLQPQHIPQQPEMAMVPAAVLQQLLAAKAAGLSPQAAANCAPPAPAAKPAGGDILAPAACLYLPSAELDVSADGAKRPVAA